MFFKVLNHMSSFQSSNNFRMFLQMLKLMHLSALVRRELDPTGVHPIAERTGPTHSTVLSRDKALPISFH